MTDFQTPNEKLKSKVKKKTTVEDLYAGTDESIIEDDDVKNDPDWTQTPFFSRVNKLRVSSQS